LFPFFGSTNNAPEQAKPPFEGLVELDEYLMSLNVLPKDISIQLSKSGSNTIGGPKISLDLGIGINDYVFMSESAKKEARARYGSYNPELRVNALSEVEANILVNYITPTGMQTLLSSQRSLRVAYKKAKSDTNALIPPSAFLLDVRPKPTPGNPQFSVPLFAYEVLFVDQNGENKDMPYEITCSGSFNFREAYDLTSGGLNTSQMSAVRVMKEQGVAGTPSGQMDAVMGQHLTDFPKQQATGQMKSDSYYHLLYQWGDMLRGSAEISIKIPQSITGSDWTHERVMSYDRMLNQNDDIEFAGKVKAQAGQILFRTRYTLDASNPSITKITIPIYVEPLPNHLVMTSDGVKSKWEMTDDVNNLADHQKVSLALRLARPRSSELWANADFNDDFAISYDEYISPEGVAARRAGRAGASPVPNTQIVFTPDPLNSWLSAKKPYTAFSNVSGYLNITLPPGRWSVSRTTDELVSVSLPYFGAKTYNELSLIEQGLMAEKYGNKVQTLSYAQNTVPMAKISVPSAFYWRETDEYDTTPTGVVGAKLVQDLTGINQDVLSGYELRQNVPALKQGKPATSDTIYQKLKGMYPTADRVGFPISGQGNTTSRQVFDTAVMLFKEDSPYDLSLVGEFERRLESESDSTVIGVDVPMPSVGGAVDYNGYKIMRVIVDATTENEISSGYYPGMEWSAAAPPFSFLPGSVFSDASTGDYTTDDGNERVINMRLPFLNGDKQDGKSFEALVYYKEHTASETNIISLYNVRFGAKHQKRLNDQIAISGENSAVSFYQDQVAELHMWSNASAAIIAGQFIPIKAPTHHTGWQQINTDLSKKSEGQIMLEAMRAIDGGGKANFPPGEFYSSIHKSFGGPDVVWNLEADIKDRMSLDLKSKPGLNPTDLKSMIEGGKNNWPKRGSDYPGSMVFFESDVFPTAMVTFPAGYDMTALFSGTQFFGNAQAHIDFVQNAGPLQAPQPYSDEEDDYNMGFGIL